MAEEFHAIATDAAAGRAVAVRGLVNHCILQQDMPVSGVSVFRRDVKIRKRLPSGVVVGRNGTGGQRAQITEFSMQSRYRLLHTCKNCNADFASMITLTYPADFPSDGKTVKLHLEEFRRRLLRKFPGILGIWFLEFQRRGAPHFHILLSLKIWELGPLVERKRHLKKLGTKIFRTVESLQDWASKAWFKIVGSGDEKHLRAGVAWEVIEEEDGALRYAACHAAKPHQKKVPKDYSDVGRFWGVVGPLKVEPLAILPADTEMVIDRVFVDSISRRGRVKKYLWDAAPLFLPSQQEDETGDDDCCHGQ